ncbi:MAG: hypothetical protein EOP50_05860 [Sphingobacteriales bacterium]|nr:MAG: hypothetical protein EOP50_05860 [Sphingobacteriales bacterium]
MTIIERAVAPTPKFFRILRLIGMVLTAIAATVIGAKTTPQEIVDIAAHVATAGAVLTAVSQLTVDDNAIREAEEKRELP